MQMKETDSGAHPDVDAGMFSASLSWADMCAVFISPASPSNAERPSVRPPTGMYGNRVCVRGCLCIRRTDKWEKAADIISTSVPVFAQFRIVFVACLSLLYTSPPVAHRACSIVLGRDGFQTFSRFSSVGISIGKKPRRVTRAGKRVKLYQM